MLILAFETSCDDTSIALFKDSTLLAMDTASQIKIHNITGGVVPEVAAREHANQIFDVLSNVLELSKYQLEDIDYLAVTTNPGLLPSLLTGTTVASTISTVLQIPILPIDHIEAHIFANFLERQESDVKFPLVCLTVSG
jgi:N6-L-threonylcarbamoyladenine synthase